MTFEEWGRKLNAVYVEGEGSGWGPEDEDAWDEVWTEFEKEFPHADVSKMDPSCGCCVVDTYVLLNFENDAARSGYEMLYPLYKPADVFKLG